MSFLSKIGFLTLRHIRCQYLTGAPGRNKSIILLCNFVQWLFIYSWLPFHITDGQLILYIVTFGIIITNQTAQLELHTFHFFRTNIINKNKNKK